MVANDLEQAKEHTFLSEYGYLAAFDKENLIHAWYQIKRSQSR